MNRSFKSILVACLGFASYQANAQDHIFSQFFNAPLYLNPALTGQFEGDLRLNLIYRNQFSGMAQNLNYLSASADINIPTFGGGVGLLFNRSSEGTAYLVKNNVAATYSYSVGGDDFVTSFGIQAGFTNRTITWDKLVFGDQIDMRLGYIPGSVSGAEMPDVSNKFFFDAAAGVNVVYKAFMAGASFYHINQPNESFSGAEAKLPIRATVNASYRIPLSYDAGYRNYEGAYLIPSVVYYQQDNQRSASFGAQLKYKNLNTGVWYRTAGQGGPDALVVSLIFDIFGGGRNGDRYRVGISHDATTSKLNYTNTSGTTEASVGYQRYFDNSLNYEKFNGLRCYDFY
jgi:type IX secretion system PorP/SprF family membrane protein